MKPTQNGVYNNYESPYEVGRVSRNDDSPAQCNTGLWLCYASLCIRGPSRLFCRKGRGDLDSCYILLVALLQQGSCQAR